MPNYTIGLTKSTGSMYSAAMEYDQAAISTLSWLIFPILADWTSKYDNVLTLYSRDLPEFKNLGTDKNRMIEYVELEFDIEDVEYGALGIENTTTADNNAVGTTIVTSFYMRAHREFRDPRSQAGQRGFITARIDLADPSQTAILRNNKIKAFQVGIKNRINDITKSFAGSFDKQVAIDQNLVFPEFEKTVLSELEIDTALAKLTEKVIELGTKKYGRGGSKAFGTENVYVILTTLAFSKLFSKNNRNMSFALDSKISTSSIGLNSGLEGSEFYARNIQNYGMPSEMGYKIHSFDGEQDFGLKILVVEQLAESKNLADTLGLRTNDDFPVWGFIGTTNSLYAGTHVLASVSGLMPDGSLYENIETLGISTQNKDYIKYSVVHEELIYPLVGETALA